MSGTATAADTRAGQAAKHELMTTFASTPYRPVGLATADQGLASVVQLLEWSTALITDATDGHPNLDRAAPPDRDLFGQAAVVLRQTGELLAQPESQRAPRPTAMDRQREASAAYHRSAAAGKERWVGDYDVGGGHSPGTPFTRRRNRRRGRASYADAPDRIRPPGSWHPAKRASTARPDDDGRSRAPAIWCVTGPSRAVRSIWSRRSCAARWPWPSPFGG